MKHLALLALLAAAPAVAFAGTPVEEAIKAMPSGSYNMCGDNTATQWPSWSPAICSWYGQTATTGEVLHVTYAPGTTPLTLEYTCREYAINERTGAWVLHPDGGKVQDHTVVVEEKTLVDTRTARADTTTGYGMEQLLTTIKGCGQ